MKVALIAVALIASSLALVDPVYEEWEKWKAEYAPHYVSSAEHDKRFRIFVENKKKVIELNKKYADDPVGARFGLNRFADLTDEEFVNMYMEHIPTGGLDNYPILPASNKALEDYPSRKDYRNEGVLNPVRDRGTCSCWPFSSVINMEGVYKVANGTLPVLSLQQLIDCDHDCSTFMGKWMCNGGCKCGVMANAFSYSTREGMTTEKAYPYQSGKVGTCRYNNRTGTVYHFKKWYKVAPNEAAMVAALNDVGPLSLGVDARTWKLYQGGIIYGDSCYNEVHQGANLVGYDSVIVNGKEVKYWILELFWGPKWGERGFLRLARGRDICAVRDYVHTVVVK